MKTPRTFEAIFYFSASSFSFPRPSENGWIVSCDICCQKTALQSQSKRGLSPR